MSTLHVRPAKDDEIETLGLGDLKRIPHFRPTMVRLGVTNDRIVSRVVLRDRTLMYGRAAIKTTCVGQIHTQEAYRQRGYAAVVMSDTLTYMREQGAHMALVHDSTSSYMSRFGFSSVWPNYTLSFSAKEAAALDQPLSLRPMEPYDLPVVAALYDRLWGGRVTFSRDPDTWIAHVTHGGWEIYVAVDDNDRPQGYIAIADPDAGLVEVIAGSSDAAMTILAFAGRWYQESGLESIQWATLPDDPFTAFARDWLDLTISVTFKPQGAWMARLVDVRGFINMILPELTAQAEMALPDFRSGALKLRPHADHIEITVYVAPAINLKLSHRDFVQLMFGSISAENLAMRVGFAANEVHLLERLFPPRLAALAPWDWF